LPALERSLSVEEPEADADRQDPKSDAVPWTTWPSAGAANPAAALRLSSLGGGPVLPFLDTSPLSHLAEPEPDLFAHIADSGAKCSGDRPYLN